MKRKGLPIGGRRGYTRETALEPQPVMGEGEGGRKECVSGVGAAPGGQTGPGRAFRRPGVAGAVKDPPSA